MGKHKRALVFGEFMVWHCDAPCCDAPCCDAQTNVEQQDSRIQRTCSVVTTCEPLLKFLVHCPGLNASVVTRGKMQQQGLQSFQGAAQTAMQIALTSTAPRYALKMEGRFRLTFVYTDVSMKMSLKRTSMPGGLIPTLHEQDKTVCV